jgi:hypothetical protein
MGRPRGLRKGPDGKWYMPQGGNNASKDSNTGNDTVHRVAAAPVVNTDPQPSVRSKRTVSMDWQRNDIVTAEDGAERKTALVLGWNGSKIVVQLLDGVTRLTLDESRVHSIGEVGV